MEIPTVMRLKLDDEKKEIENIDEILEYIEIVDDKYLLEYYINALKNEPILDMDMIKIILDKVNERLNILNDVNTLQELFIVAKDNTEKLNNISIIDTPRYMNDKIDGFRKDVTYIKLNHLDEMYEIRNVDKVKKFLNNKEIIETLNEEDIIRFLRENCDKIETKEIDINKNDELTSESIKKEIESINDPYLKEMFIKEQNDILKERVEIDKYVKTNLPDKNIEYGINSNGERIYTVGDKIIKFEGEERNMQILDQTEVKENDVKEEKFNEYKKGNETKTDFLNENVTNIYEYDGKEELLNTIIEAIFNGIGLSDEQLDFFTKFLDKCVTNEELGYTNPGNIQQIFDKYYEYAITDTSVTNDRIKAILERKKNLLNKTDTNDYEKDYKVEHTKILKFIPKQKDDNLTELDKAAFVSVAIILEGTLVGTLIIALLALVK